MTLLPFDLVLTVAASAAILWLGLFVWARHPTRIGTILFGLMAFSFSAWTAADWLVHIETIILPPTIIGWKMLLYLSACLGPSLAIHAAVHLARRPTPRQVRLLYVLSAAAFFALAAGLIGRSFPSLAVSTVGLLTLGASTGLVLTIVAAITIGIELYPHLHASALPLVERRRAAYGILILTPFLIANILQFTATPLPTGFILPSLASLFLIFSLMAFLRTAWLDVEMQPLEVFLLFLVAFATVIFLRSRDEAEALVTFFGTGAVAAFGILAVHDVRSERAQREHAEDMAKEFKAIEEAKSDFVAMVAHQLRSPLGGIRSSAAMLEAGDYGAVPTKAREAAILMRSAAARLLALAETYLNVSKLDMGRFETTPIPTNVRSDVQEIVDEMASAAQTKGLRLHVTFAPGFPEVLVLDQEVLRHVVFNLLDNAVKYTEQGMVSLALAKTDTDVVIEVWDTGPGMSQEEIHHLFQKFHRGSAGNAHATDGTGLGLFIVRRLVEAAHGHIAVTSQGADTGTTFRVTLPAHEVV